MSEISLFSELKSLMWYEPLTWEDMEEFIGEIVYSKDKTLNLIIIDYNEFFIYLEDKTMENYYYTYQEIFDYFIFKNGSPIGKYTKK